MIRVPEIFRKSLASPRSRFLRGMRDTLREFFIHDAIQMLDDDRCGGDFENLVEAVLSEAFVSSMQNVAKVSREP